VVAWAAERGCTARDGRQLADLAEAGDAVARAALARAGAAVGRAAASAAALLDLRLVVVGGGLSLSGAALWGPLEQAFADQAQLDFLTGSAVVPAFLGAETGLLGAAALVLQGERYWSAD
jgi:glucokinase